MQIAPTLLNPELAEAGKKAPVTDIQKQRIHKAAMEFEAVFLNEMLKPMFEGTSSEDTAFGGSREETIFQSMMVDKISSGLSQSGGIGIAKHIEKELLRLQEAR